MQVLIDPKKANSVTTIRVRFCETDLMQIVHHATYLAYFEIGRVEWLRSRGATYARWAAGGKHWPVVEVALRYKAPAHFDDLLTLHTTLTELRAYSLRYEYRIEREGTLLTSGSTRLACIDDEGKLVRFSDDMLQVLHAAEMSA